MEDNHSILNEEVTNEAAAVETQPAEAAPAEQEAPRKALQTKDEVIARLKEIAEAGGQTDRSEIEALKQTYYRLHNAEAAAARAAFIEAGGSAEDFVPAPDTQEEAFKEELNRVKLLRAEAAEAVEQERADNLARKQAIIEKIKEMTASAETVDKAYDEFKELQAAWKEIGAVPAEQSTEIWKNYQHYVEQFYDLLRLNHEFRALDFKKNLEAKTHLCEAAEKLAEVADPISAFHQLQQLHQQFREIGPVAKELREEVWTRFKNASTVVNKRHQEHFEQLKAREEENLAKKTALCEQIEGIELEGLKSFADWDKVTKQVIDWQNEWKTIGFTPKKVNAQIFERFRAACDRIFQRKAEYFKQQRETWSANLEAKTKLCEAAEALQESTDWGATTNKFVELQKQWKAIGPVAHKVSDAIWKRFNSACNAFFEKKNAATSGQRQEEEANWETKNGIVEQLEKLLAEGAENAQEAFRELTARWNEVGHVPFRKKDALFKRYHEALDRLRTEFHLSAGRRSVENFRRNVVEKAGTELERELAKLKSIFEAKRDEIKNYETNLTFFTSKSKSGNSLVEEITKKIDRLKQDLDTVKEKIAAVREKIKEEEG